MIKAAASLFYEGCLFRNLIFNLEAALNILLVPRTIERNRNM